MCIIWNAYKYHNSASKIEKFPIASVKGFLAILMSTLCKHLIDYGILSLTDIIQESKEKLENHPESLLRSLMNFLVQQ